MKTKHNWNSGLNVGVSLSVETEKMWLYKMPAGFFFFGGGEGSVKPNLLWQCEWEIMQNKTKDWQKQIRDMILMLK